jgi:hypothetical protein
MSRHVAGLFIVVWSINGCSSLLPRTDNVVESPWQSYQEAQQAFDKIVPGETQARELRTLKLDPASNPNIAILNYLDVLRRFMPNASLSVADLDAGVRDCISAKTVCRGFEINQKAVTKQRNGNFFLDMLNFKRKTQTGGWSFSGLILLKEEVVVYKLTGGQPSIVELEESNNPLGPLQSIGVPKLLGLGQ